MQTEKSQPSGDNDTMIFQAEGKRIMPKTRFPSFPALSVDPNVGFLGLHRRPIPVDFFSSLSLKISKF